MPNKVFYKLIVCESSRDREFWVNEARSSEVVDGLRSSNLIIVPWVDYGDAEFDYFPQGTTEFFANLKNQFDGAVFLASSPDFYREVALHSNLKRLPTVFVDKVGYPVLATVIGGLILAAALNSQDDNVSLEVVIDAGSDGCIELNYEGPASQSVDALIEQAARCLPNHQSQQPKPNNQKDESNDHFSSTV